MRLDLRRLEVADLDALEDLDADPEVTRFIKGGRPTPRAELRDEVLPFWLGYYERGEDWGFWAAIDRGSGAFLGWFHLRPGRDDPPDQPELGASRVYATTMAINTASRRVMEKAGMRLVRHFHGEWPEPVPGDEHGDVEYAITRAEWDGQRRAAVSA